MGKASEKKPGKHICIGILAHVDAGKTTLAEGILYQCGTIHKAGRVDHGNAFLDTHEMERARGITIFSKQARLRLGDMAFTLLDTRRGRCPGACRDLVEASWRLWGSRLFVCK